MVVLIEITNIEGQVLGTELRIQRFQERNKPGEQKRPHSVFRTCGTLFGRKDFAD